MAGAHVFAVGATPTLIIHEVEGDLSLTGWERPELVAHGPKAGDINTRPDGEGGTGVVELLSQRRCTIQTPLQTTLQVDG